MTPQPTVLDEARALIEERLREVEAERRELESGLKHLGGTARKGTARSSGQKRRPATSAEPKRRRRRRRGGTRADHALKAVQGKPGITASEIATKLKIKPNYIYRVMADLVDDGLVIKTGRGYQAV